MFKKFLSLLLFIFTLLLMPLLIVLNFVSPRTYQSIKNKLFQIEKSLDPELKTVSEINHNSSILLVENKPVQQPDSIDWQKIQELMKDDEFDSEIVDKSADGNSSLYRYELDYKDRFGNKTTRYIDVIAVQKEWGNNRWYFVADTEEGERTFKSERVIELRDSWTGEVFSTSKSVREHIVKNYPETDDAFDD